MTPRPRLHPVPLGAELALAFLAGLGAFAVAGVALAGPGPDVVMVVIGLAGTLTVIAIARAWGVAYAVPTAMAGLLAFEWFRVPPRHQLAVPGGGDMLALMGYLAVAVLVGELAARAIRRSDEARSDLADEQAALRRVATLVARGEPPGAVFGAVAQEVGVLLGLDGARVVRYVSDEEILQLEGWHAPGKKKLPGGPLKLEGPSASVEVLRTGAAVRIDDYGEAHNAVVRGMGVRSAVAAPIVVDGSLWGAMIAWSLRPGALAEDAESRLAAFTELVATAISNAASRQEVVRLADEQAALQRVATLVAREAPPREVFAAVAEEVARLLEVDNTKIYRYERDGTATVVADWGEPGARIAVGTRLTMEGENVAGGVLRTQLPARVDDYAKATGSVADLARRLGIRSAVGTPVVVEGRLWGTMIAVSLQDTRLPADAERRMGQFTRLVATAISNTEARAEIARLADEQAALRRVATLVARGASPAAVFDAVVAEAARVVGAERVSLLRYEPDASAAVLMACSDPGGEVTTGSRLTLDGESIAAVVLRDGRPARVDDWQAATGSIAELMRAMGVRSSFGVPIFVEGRLWGAMSASWTREPPTARDTMERLAEFAELLDTAIANADSRAELTASRARVLAAGDDARRRVARDLHDGAQQHLVHTIVTLKLAQQALRDHQSVESLVGEGIVRAEQAHTELRELAHGMLPSVLTRGGLRAGVDALVSRIDLAVTVDVPRVRFEAGVEASAYFIVAEALTNVVKHSGARHAGVTASVGDGLLRVEVRDDGAGGAMADGGGLVGLHDRVEALGGCLNVDSPPGGGTRIGAALPLPL